jgi:pilus assembly protein CpaB
MTRRTRFPIVIIVALSAALASSYLVYQVAERQAAPAPPPRVGQLVVAARSAPIGARIAAGDVRLVEWPLDHMVPGSFSSLEQVVGRGLATAVVGNEPLTEAKLAPREAGFGLPSAIPPGQRAISVRVNEVIGVAGFVGPGGRVDVIATLRAGQDSTARVLVSNVLVLTVGTRSDQDATLDIKPGSSTVVTLAVTPGQAQRIALAQVEGQLTLTLRNPMDADEAIAPEVRLTALQGVEEPRPRPQPVAPSRPRTPAVMPTAPAPPAPAAAYMVETIVAGKRSEGAITGKRSEGAIK